MQISISGYIIIILLLSTLVLDNQCLIASAQVDSNSLITRGKSFIKDNDYSAAISCFDSVLAEQPENREVLYNKSLALYFMSKHKDSLVVLNQLLSLSAFDREALFLKGLVLYESGDFNEAIVTIDKLIAMDPGNLSARSLKCNALRESGNKNEADKCVQNLPKK